LPWGPEKVERLRQAGVAVARTPAGGPAVDGTVELLRTAGDRLVRVEGTRPEFALVAEAEIVGSGASLGARVEPKTAFSIATVEMPREPAGRRCFGTGRLDVLERGTLRQRLRVEVTPPGGLLVVARTFDPSWRAAVDGRPVPSLRADGFLTAVLLPAGRAEVELSYANPLISWGAAVTLAACALAAVLLARLR
jgi:hypothetical protein